MAKENPQINLNEAITVTAGDLLALFNTLQQNQAKQSAEQNSALIEGLKQLSPHYQDPGQQENNKNLKEATRKIAIFKIKKARRDQKNCKHMVGQTGRRLNGEGAFCGLKLCTGEVIGICMYCQLVISSANPNHQKYFQQINGTVAESGQMTGGVNDMAKAQLARLGEDERKHVEAARAKYFLETPKEEEVDDLEFV